MKKTIEEIIAEMISDSVCEAFKDYDDRYRNYVKYINDDEAINPNGYRPPLIKEGLIRSYPTFNTVSFVYNSVKDNRLKFYAPNAKYLSGKDIDDYITIYFDEKYRDIECDRADGGSDTFDAIEKAMDVCGYFFSEKHHAEINGKNCIVWRFEPKYQESTEVYPSRFMYHLSVYQYKDSIKDNGIVPKGYYNKDKYKKFNYPPRAYFFLDPSSVRYYARISNKNSLEYVNGKLKRGNKFVVFVVDTEKFNRYIRFYEDNNFPSFNAIYTYENIPPSAIVGCYDLRL